MKEALSCPEVPHWQAAAGEKYNSLVSMSACELISVPTGKESIPCTWGLQEEAAYRWSIERCKARLLSILLPQSRSR